MLDAKYRIEEGLPDALNSIHTYRDALVREADGRQHRRLCERRPICSRRMLPGTETRLSGHADAGTAVPSGIPGSFRFGAVTLRPGMSVAEIARRCGRGRRCDGAVSACHGGRAHTGTAAAQHEPHPRPDTKPELLLRRGLHALGFRFRLHRRDLPGRPDLVFRVARSFSCTAVSGTATPVRCSSCRPRGSHFGPRRSRLTKHEMIVRLTLLPRQGGEP